MSKFLASSVVLRTRIQAESKENLQDVINNPHKIQARIRGERQMRGIGRRGAGTFSLQKGHRGINSGA